jgi:hypothetical protein
VSGCSPRTPTRTQSVTLTRDRCLLDDWEIPLGHSFRHRILEDGLPIQDGFRPRPRRRQVDHSQEKLQPLLPILGWQGASLGAGSTRRGMSSIVDLGGERRMGDTYRSCVGQ